MRFVFFFPSSLVDGVLRVDGGWHRGYELRHGGEHVVPVVFERTESLDGGVEIGHGQSHGITG